MTNPADHPAPNRNAVRHGLAAEFPQSKAEADHLRILTATFTARLRPADDVEKALVRHAAASVLRLERCEEAERAVEGPNLVAALRDWERDRRHAVRRRAQSLAEDPVGTVDALEQSAFGCDWLLRKWAGLRDLALARRGWTSDATRLALRLLGHRPEAAGPPDDPDAAVILAAAGALHDGDPAGADPAVAGFAALADREIARLTPLRDAGWSAVECPERGAVLSNARLDTSPSGRLRHRYTQDAERSIGRSLDLLTKFRKAEQAAAELPDRTFANPRPVAPPAERPADSGAPAQAPPSRNEPKSTVREAAAPVRIVKDSNGLHTDAPHEPISALRHRGRRRRRTAAPRGRPAGPRDRPGPPPDVLRAGQARSGPPCPCLSRNPLSQSPGRLPSGRPGTAGVRPPIGAARSRVPGVVPTPAAMAGHVGAGSGVPVLRSGRPRPPRGKSDAPIRSTGPPPLPITHKSHAPGGTLIAGCLGSSQPQCGPSRCSRPGRGPRFACWGRDDPRHPKALGAESGMPRTRVGTIPRIRPETVLGGTDSPPPTPESAGAPSPAGRVVGPGGPG